VTSLESGTGTVRPLPSGRWFVAAVLLFVVIAGFFDRISIAVLFTDKGFNEAMGTNFSPPLLGLLMTSFLVAYGVSGALLSVFGDIYGPRRGLAICSGLWGIFMGLMGSTGSYGAMLLCRVLLGIAEGPQFSLINTAVKRWFPIEEQARANSVWMVGSPLGSAIGFPLSIAVVAAFGWRASFYALAALNLVVVVPLVVLCVRDWPRLGEGEDEVRPRATTGKDLKSNIGLFLKDWRFWLVVSFNSACLVYLWGLNAWLPTYLQAVRHFDVTSLGFFSSFPFVLMFVGELVGGYVSDRLGRRAIVCFIGLFGAAVLIYVVSLITNPYEAAIVIALSAGFWGSALPPLFALGAQIIPASAISSGVGAYNGIGNLVGALSPLLMGWSVHAFGNFDAGLMVLVFAGVLGASAILPLLKRY
jgi:sugar phosphate permease